MTDSADTLIEKVRRGDAQALAAFIEIVRPKLLAFIERRLGAGLRRKMEAEDVLQEVSTEAVKALAETDLAQRDPYPWLCQMAEWRIVDAHRHFGAKKRDIQREAPAVIGASPSRGANLIDMLVQSLTTPSQAFDRNLHISRLNRALLELSEEQREALRMRYVEGMASKEIASQMGKTDGSIRVMLARAVKRLQTIMESGQTA